MRPFLFLAGWIATALGALGLLLPLLPTTPFLLLAAACFAKSSPRSRAWLLDSPWLGPPLRDYLEHRVVKRRTRFLALALLWPSVAYSAVEIIPIPAVGAGLLAVAMLVSLYLLSLPTTKPPG